MTRRSTANIADDTAHGVRLDLFYSDWSPPSTVLRYADIGRADQVAIGDCMVGDGRPSSSDVSTLRYRRS